MSEFVISSYLNNKYPNKETRPSWDTFSKRFLSGRQEGAWWGCVNKEGEWYDSALMFGTACHWIAMQHGWGMMTEEEQKKYHSSEEIFIYQVSTDSVIHSSMLEKMYEAGLIH